jgi:hypothetical protein
MAEAQGRFTKRSLDQADARERPYFLWDGHLKGLGARIDPSGAKTFVLRYRPKSHGANSPKRFVTIGRYGVLTVDEARNRAREILGAVREQSRLIGRPLARRSVGSTLLLKGLEADISVVLNAGALNARNLYVAMTRGSRRVLVCSPTPILNPPW